MSDNKDFPWWMPLWIIVLLVGEMIKERFLPANEEPEKTD